jgi:hypothetical protein
MAKTDWQMNDIVQPADMNLIGQEINNASSAAAAAQETAEKHAARHAAGGPDEITPAMIGAAPISHVGAGGNAHAAATTSQDGFMSAADKSKLDTATSAATPNTLVQRDAAGRMKAAAPASSDDAATKGYVDTNFPCVIKLGTAGSGTVYNKIAELTTNIGNGGNGLILYINGTSDYGNNVPGLDMLQVSTRGSVGLRVYTLLPQGSQDIRYGYVNNSSTGKTEIWLRRDAFCQATEIIVAQVHQVTVGNLVQQSTEPAGITYVNKIDFITSDGGKTITGRFVYSGGAVTGQYGTSNQYSSALVEAQVPSASGGVGISFHRSGNYATWFGLANDNVIRAVGSNGDATQFEIKARAPASTDYTSRQFRNIIFSTSTPSGGQNGDVWMQYE